MTQLVLTQQRDHIFEIILNRPDKRNAINMDMFRQFDTAVIQANRTPACAPCSFAARAKPSRRAST